MERIKTYTSFKTETKPEIEELHRVGKVHEDELKTDEEIEGEETAEEFLQNAAEDEAAIGIQMDETASNISGKTKLKHLKEFA